MQGRGSTYSKGAESFDGTFPTVAILFKAGGCPVKGGGVVVPVYGGVGDRGVETDNFESVPRHWTRLIFMLVGNH